MTEKKQQTAEPRAYKTLSDLMEQPSGECLDVIARVAPALERFVNRSGVIRSLLENQGKANTEAEAVDMAETMVSAILRYAMGECQSEAVEIVAAVNGMTVKQLRAECNGWEVARMIKALVSDKGFFSSLRTLLD
jgi:hypothetical protein